MHSSGIFIYFIAILIYSRRKYKRSFAYDPNAQLLSSKPIYQPVNVGQSGGKGDVGLHPNPAYAVDVGDKMNMDNNLA